MTLFALLLLTEFRRTSIQRILLVHCFTSLFSSVLSFVNLLVISPSKLPSSEHLKPLHRPFDGTNRYCPDGNVPMSIPGGSNIWELMEENGDNVNNEHWAPLGEAQNGWIQIGWHEGQTCKTYEQLSGMDPSWGVSGIDSFEVTGYIMCCLEPFSINDSLSTEKVTPTQPEDTEEEIDQVYDVIARSFEPILYDRNRGWDGSTYDEAVQFCSKSSPARVLCPVEV